MNMKPHTINSQNNFIAGWYADTTICNDIVAKGEENPAIFSKGIKEYRDYDLKKFDTVLYERYVSELFAALEEYKKVYPLSYEQLKPWGLTPPRIQRYDPGKAYRIAHCENDGTTPVLKRHLAYMTFLNTVKDGGGTEFLQQNFIAKAETGLTLFWPAGWTHYHRGIVSETEIKYIITGWCDFYPQ
jgi:prolyl 4-hydroxylase